MDNRDKVLFLEQRRPNFTDQQFLDLISDNEILSNLNKGKSYNEVTFLYQPNYDTLFMHWCHTMSVSALTHQGTIFKYHMTKRKTHIPKKCTFPMHTDYTMKTDANDNELTDITVKLLNKIYKDISFKQSR